MKHISLMIKPASSLCNLRCKYCFYADVSDQREVKSFGLMNVETANKIVENVWIDLKTGDEVTFAFQGGEPTLAGLEFFETFIQIVKETCENENKNVSIHYALQTNGILLDSAWCQFLKQNNFLVGLSLDGPADFHDENRVDECGKGTFSRVIQAKQKLEKYKIQYNVLWVLTNHHARYPKKVWNFLSDNEIDFVQFIPCLANLNEESDSLFALDPNRFASFYTQLLDFWKRDFQKGKYRSIKFFDDIFNLILKHQITACGITGQCQAQFIVEADGSVYPCDFYVLDEWKSGNLKENTVTEVLNNTKTQAFLSRPRQSPRICTICKWEKICGGGCPRMATSMYVNKVGDYCGYRQFLDENAEILEKIARDIQNRTL